MTNTKFRKRMLLSSVAMLLVALVALGSATFAWFSTTNTASASAMNAKTNKASNILLNEYKTDEDGFVGDWQQTLTLSQNTASGTTNGNIAMEPVTTKDFTTWNNVKATVYNQGFATGAYTDVTSNIKKNGKYVKYTSLYIKNTGESTTATISANATPAVSTNTLGENYLRVALVPRAAGSKDVTAAVAAPIVYGDGNDRSNAAAGWNSSDVTDQADSIVTTAMGGAASLGTLTKDAIYAFDVYVYYEGTDFQCKDDVAGGDINVTFNVAKTA